MKLENSIECKIMQLSITYIIRMRECAKLASFEKLFLLRYAAKRPLWGGTEHIGDGIAGGDCYVLYIYVYTHVQTSQRCLASQLQFCSYIGPNILDTTYMTRCDDDCTATNHPCHVYVYNIHTYIRWKFTFSILFPARLYATTYLI